MDLVHKIHGHKDKDEGDPEKPVAKYSKLFKSTFGPLYDTLEGTAFDFSEDESSFVVNSMFQVCLSHLQIITQELISIFFIYVCCIACL